jgi:hypothetical protein
LICFTTDGCFLTKLHHSFKYQEGTSMILSKSNQRANGGRMLDAGCWMLDAGCWMLDAGCWMLDAGCWMLDAGCWMLDAGCWIEPVKLMNSSVRQLVNSSTIPDPGGVKYL